MPAAGAAGAAGAAAGGGASGFNRITWADAGAAGALPPWRAIGSGRPCVPVASAAKNSPGDRAMPSRRAISSSSAWRRAGMAPRRTQPLTAVCQMPSSSATRACEPNLRMM
ncbi:MAG: hypothetical protein R3C69_01365 [Geminicoccaceae bacterium]